MDSGLTIGKKRALIDYLNKISDGEYTFLNVEASSTATDYSDKKNRVITILGLIFYFKYNGSKFNISKINWNLKLRPIFEENIVNFLKLSQIISPERYNYPPGINFQIVNDNE